MNPIVDLIQRYKKHIKNTELKDEVYKWELLKTYKGRPHPNAQDFTEEIGDIKFQNLLYQMSTAVINHIAKEYPVELSEKFEFLFNENESLLIRLNTFKAETLKLYRKLEDKLGTHQDERSMATYLTLHNPEKYTFYKSSFYKKYCKLIGVKPAKAGQKYIHYLELINDLVENYVKKDTELIDLVKTYIPEQYNSDNYLLIVQDMLYQMLDKKAEEKELSFDDIKKEYSDWLKGSENSNKINSYLRAIDILNELLNKNIYLENDIEELTRLYKDLIEEQKNKEGKYYYEKAPSYGNNGFYSAAVKGFIEFLKEKGEMKNIDTLLNDFKEYLNECNYADYTKETYFDNFKYYLENYIKENRISEIYTVEHFKYFTTIDFFEYEKKTVNGKGHSSFTHFFKYLLLQYSINTSENKLVGSLNQILYGPPGTGKTFALKQDYFSRYTTKETSITKEKHLENVVKECSWWQVVAVALLELKKAKVSEIFEHAWVKQKTVLSDSKTVRQTIWGQLQRHTIETCEYVGVKKRRAPFIFNKTENSDWEILEDEVKDQAPELYDLLDSVNRFTPNHNKEIKRYKFTTFHQSFSYEDFIEGIKPIMPENGEESEDLGYKIEDGVFKQLCIDAGNDPENRYAIFIDEINRGNVSSIFGELITLIEPDKRKGAKNEIEALLPYSKKVFSVPKNLDIYGTMNTADRSVEALDSALRRRFSFVEMMPKSDLLKDIVIEDIALEELLKTINERIEILVDRDHTIGHAYFINVSNKKELKETFKNSIIPLLQEYFFGDYGKIGLVLGEGFVKSVQPKTNIFANFKNYEGAQDYNQVVFELINIDEDFNIIEAIQSLMPKKEVEA